MKTPYPRMPGEIWKHLESAAAIELGELALALGLLDDGQLTEARSRQREHGRPLSQVLLELGHVSPKKLEDLVREQQELAEPDPSAMRFGKFLLLQEIGRGGMGIVWRAWDTQLSRAVALKGVDLEADKTVRALFLREARLAAKLSHPNIVPVYEVLEENGKAAIAMGLVEGIPLAPGMPDMPIRRVLEIIRDAARAVHYAHEQGVIHRDVKPQNLMVDQSGRVYVLDFGLAKPVEGGVSLSATGAIVGTPIYMSPEQARGSSDVGPSTDIYSLGATLYALATDQDPFLDGAPYEVIHRVVNDDPPAPSQIKPGLHRDVEIIILKAMEKEPGQRYASAADLADDIERYLGGEAITARPVSVVTKAAKKIRKHRYLAASMFIALVALVYAAFVLMEGAARDARRARAQPSFDLGVEAFDRAEKMFYQPGVDPKMRSLEFRKAVALMTEAVGIDPAFAEAFAYRGHARWSLGETAEGFRDLDEATRLHPALRRAYVVRGMLRVQEAHEKKGKGEDVEALFAGALADFERARTLADSPIDRLLASAVIAYSRGNYEDAIKLLDTFLESETANAWAFRIRADCRSELGQLDEAEDDYTTSITLRVGDPATYFHRGMLRLGRGDKAGAKADADKVRELAPGRAEYDALLRENR